MWPHYYLLVTPGITNLAALPVLAHNGDKILTKNIHFCEIWMGVNNLDFRAKFYILIRFSTCNPNLDASFSLFTN